MNNYDFNYEHEIKSNNRTLEIFKDVMKIKWLLHFLIGMNLFYIFLLMEFNYLYLFTCLIMFSILIYFLLILKSEASSSEITANKTDLNESSYKIQTDDNNELNYTLEQSASIIVEKISHQKIKSNILILTNFLEIIFYIYNNNKILKEVFQNSNNLDTFAKQFYIISLYYFTIKFFSLLYIKYLFSKLSN